MKMKKELRGHMDVIYSMATYDQLQEIKKGERRNDSFNGKTCQFADF